jgi:hypothetical protein
VILRRTLLAGGAAALLAVAPALASLPQVDYALSGPLGDGGWYVGPVTVKWTVAGELSSDCNTQTLSADTKGTQIPCSATNAYGTTSALTLPIRIDQTPPTDVTASSARGPDVRSWFTSPVGITWSGTDGTSGIASCTSLSYAGPDATAASPVGTCRDQAGNVSAPVPFSLAYDATPPTLDTVTAVVGPQRADIRWHAGADAVRATVVRQPHTGKVPTTVADVSPAVGVAADTGLAPATRYTWTVTVIDSAGNAASQQVSATTPAATQLLRWPALRGARYYNVQVFLGSHKVLSAWPAHAHYLIAAAWRYRGHRRRLLAGRTYRWYAWPGFGPRSAQRYGRLRAHGTFSVPAGT